MADNNTFDPVAEARKSPDWDLSGFSDQQLFQHLTNPAKFRQIFPDYSSLSDDEIRNGMTRTALRNPLYTSTPSSLPPSVQSFKTGQYPVPPIIAQAAQPGGAMPTKEQAAKSMTEMPMSMPEKIAARGADVGIGLGKSLAQTATNVAEEAGPGPILERFGIPSPTRPYVEAIRRATEPTTTSQKVGGFVGDVVPFLIPGEQEEAAVSEMTKAVPLLSKVPTLARMAYGAATTGAISEAEHPGTGTTGAVIGAAVPLVGRAAQPVLDWLGNTVPGRMINGLIRPTTKTMKYGKNPGEAIADEGITAGSIKNLQANVQSRISDLYDQLTNAFGSSAQKAVDTTNAVLGPIDQAIAEATQGRVANAPLAKSLGQLRDSITHELTYDGGGNLVRGNPKNLVMSPTDALKFKQEVGDMINWSQENAAHYGNLVGVKREIYRGIDNLLDKIAPGTKELNDRMSDLINAKEAVTRVIPLMERHASFLRRVGLPGLFTTGTLAGEMGHGGGVSLEHLLTAYLSGVSLNAVKDLAASTPAVTGAAQAARFLGQRALPAVGSAVRAVAPAVASRYDEHPAVKAAEAANPNFFPQKQAPPPAPVKKKKELTWLERNLPE